MTSLHPYILTLSMSTHTRAVQAWRKGQRQGYGIAMQRHIKVQAQRGVVSLTTKQHHIVRGSS